MIDVVFAVCAAVLLVGAGGYARRFQGEYDLARGESQERERVRLELLYAVAAAGEDLGLDVSANRLADALVPVLGDWVMVTLLDRDGGIDTLAVSGPDDEHGRVVEELLRRYPVELDVEQGVGLAIRSGEDGHTLDLLGAVADQAGSVLDNARLHRDLVQTDRALRFSEAVLRAQGESGVEGLLVVPPRAR